MSVDRTTGNFMPGISLLEEKVATDLEAALRQVTGQQEVKSDRYRVTTCPEA